MINEARPNLDYAIAWRMLAELLRRHHARLGLSIYWSYPATSGPGVASLGARDSSGEWKPILDLDLGKKRGTVGRGNTAEQRVKYVDDFLTAPDTLRVVDALALAAGLGPTPRKLPESTGPVLCARVIAGVLERRAIGRKIVRTSPAYFDNHGGVLATPWLRLLPATWAEVGRTRAMRGGSDESLVTGHIFLVHSGAGFASELPDDLPAVAFDFRDGMAHAFFPGSTRAASLPLLETYAASGRELEPLVDWADRHLP